MNLDKSWMNKVLQETVEEFSAKVAPVDDTILIRFVEKSYFLDGARKDMGMALFIEKGIFTNFEKEYPNFLVVYQADKYPARKLLGLPFYISVCFEIAKEQAKQFKADDFREFLKHGFAHEMAHVYQEEIKRTKPEYWTDLLTKNNGSEYLAHEQLAENIADMVGNAARSDQVQKKLWEPIYARARKLGYGT
jgi:hypothetical protein